MKEDFMFEQISRTRRFGYTRVSSQTQENNSSLEAQKEEFIQKGVPEKNIRIEVGSKALISRTFYRDSSIIADLNQDDCTQSERVLEAAPSTFDSLIPCD